MQKKIAKLKTSKKKKVTVGKGLVKDLGARKAGEAPGGTVLMKKWGPQVMPESTYFDFVDSASAIALSNRLASSCRPVPGSVF